MRFPTALASLVVLASVTSVSAREPSAAGPPAAQGPKWEWTIAPYIWGAGVSLDVEADGNPVFGADASFSDLLDKLDLAGMLHFEARHGKAGLFADALYMSLSDDSVSAGNPPIPDGTQIDTSLKMGTYELGGFYRPGGKDYGFDLLFGARLITDDQTLDATFPGPLGATTSADVSDSYLDGFVGVRYGAPIGRRWDFIVRGDVAAGGTDITWNGAATFGFKFGKTGRYSLRGGYRYLDIHLGQTTDRGTDVTSTMTFSGPILGFVFRF